MLDFQVLLLSCLDAPFIFAYRKTVVDVYFFVLFTLGVEFWCLFCLTQLF